MKLNVKKLSVNELLNNNDVLQLIIHSLLLAFFYLIKIYRRLFCCHSQTVMVISLHKLGDTVFTIPAITEVRKKYGENTIIICLPESIPIYKLAFNNVNVISLKSDDYYFGNRIAKSKARRRLKLLKPSLVIDITGSMKSASLIFNLRAKKIIGTNGDQFRTIYDHFIEFRKLPKLADIYLDAVSPVIDLSNRDQYVELKKNLNPDGDILIHPFAGWKEKEWNLKKIIYLASLINIDYKVRLVVQDNQLYRDVTDEINNLDIEVFNSGSVDILIEQIKKCSLFIGNDSGPVNIANYLGKPTLTIYGATNPDYTVSAADHQVYIQKSFRCSAPKNEKYCAIGLSIYSCSGMQCMNYLSVDEVYKSLVPMMRLYCKRKITVLPANLKT